MSGRDIRNIAEIMRNDFKSAFSNPIVILVLIALIILPSLYALINIQACWNPYENTGDVEFAIANLDNGSNFEGNKLNIGNELVKELKNNDKFKWTFVTEDELRDGVYNGDYYAGIVIPKNLTKNVLSITGDHPKQAELEYIVNIKQNPVAAKLADSGSNAVYTKLNAKIVEFINMAAYGKLGELQEGLSSGASQLASGGSQLADGSAQIASGAGQVSSGVGQVEQGASKLQDGASKLQDGASRVQDGASKVQDGASKVQGGVSKVQDGAQSVSGGAAAVKQNAEKVESGASKINEGAAAVSQNSAAVKQGAAELQEKSKQIQSSVDPSQLPPGPLREYGEANAKLAQGSAQLAGGSSKLADGSTSLAKGSSQLASGSGAVAGGASDLAEGSVSLAQGSSELASASGAVANGASGVANGASGVANGASGLANGSVELANGSLSLAAGSQLLSSSASQALITAASSLAGSANSLSNITGINETILGEYFFAPVKLEKQELFPVPDYGSQVAPFYLVLSMWVGALITCVMLKPGISEGTKYSPLEMYFGKLLLFVIMSILQVSVTLIGAFILGVYVVNWTYFILSALLVSAVFMVLLYSLMSALGHVGKGLAVIILVIQISGTGGIYPIEIMHQFFQSLYPYLPMTYAITLIREAQLGMVWSNYLPALTILLAIGIVTVIASVIIKERADKAAHYFEGRLEDSGLF